MKLLKTGLALSMVGVGLAAMPSLGAQASPAPAGDNLVAQMRDDASGSVTVSTETATGKVGFIRATRDLLPGRTAGNAETAAAKVDAYLADYAGAFGARAGELKQVDVVADKVGWTVKYAQEFKGVPVFGAVIKANVDKQGDLTAVDGFAAPDLALSTTPRLTATQAGQRAVLTVKAQPPGEDPSATDMTGIAAKAPTLVVYRLGSTRSETGKAVLAWQVEVTNDKNVRDTVIVSDATGKPVNRWSMVHDALDRRLYEADANRNLTLAWQEGDPLLPDPAATVNADQDSMVKSTGDAYWIFKNAFGRDSYDGAGHRMNTINNDPAIACPNANWNGTTTNYCDGVSSDDVVAHEWGHAYTEYTSGLIYQWQSGALNESFSDVWGETADLINGRLDESEGDLTVKRPVGQCSSHSAANPLVTITAPSTIAGDCLTGGYMGPEVLPTIASDVVVALDAGPSTTDGCSPFTNASAVADKIAMVDRGTCTFVTKAGNAKAAGVAALIIGNRDNAPVGFSSPDTTLPPTVSIGLDKREAIRAQLAANQPVTATIKDASGARFDSYRWLMGEKSEAFGGAIRDMWAPTCYGDPGKVSDAEYKCDGTSDHGGVHSNSGVPNHAYALLVDGGTYNGVTVNGIGIDKAANLWWRTQSAYLTPTSNFTDMADALDASCADLTGTAINKVSVTPNGAQLAAPITAADCASVSAVARAVELRKEPVQCNFQPLLTKGSPSPCGPGLASAQLFTEDFESGLGSWSSDQTVTFPAGHGIEWVATSAAPDNHAGTVAFGPTPDDGDCAGGANDISSRDAIISPSVALPSGGASPRLTFEHYVATESGFDGANVSVSVNNGPFEVIPADAYAFNGPNAVLDPAVVQGQPFNTNPMAGEEAFSGTDGGKASGSWGTSIVDLSKVGVAGPATVRFRFNVGRDGCGGVDGWYVDNVSVSVCEAATVTTAVHKPEPSLLGQASTVDVKVARNGNTGLPPKGQVSLIDEHGVTLSTGTLLTGAATLAVPGTIPAGVHVMKVAYAGDHITAPSSAPVTVTVQGPAPTPTPTPTPTPSKASTTTHVKVRPARVERGEAFKVIVSVTSAAGEATGKVKVLLDGTKIGRLTLDDGRAMMRVEKFLKLGKHKVVAKYLGSATMLTSSDDVRLRVIR
ncbi:M4 family metallopeptidase [Nocardioides sp.]|uniref:M4 family metallopeptidase n=1 Tax=Nocardioides sp. TaxID=35761 RepID=UPI00286E1460|nr:M4 family metallopeptidase [Nocardioides sp.]